MKRPRLIILYGFAGVGKTTLAKKLSHDIPFSLNIEADNLLNMIGQWELDENKGREYVYSLSKALIRTHLTQSHDVVLPYLLLDPIHVIEFEKIVRDVNAVLTELFIDTNKSDSISYLYERGTWGESETVRITEKDRSHIEGIYDQMEIAMKCRNNLRIIPYFRNDIIKTYSGIKSALEIN